MPTRLPDSPDDRARRDELLRRIAVRAGIALVPSVLVGALAVGLGVPVWLVVVACALFAAIIVFET
jgi:heme A synthase